MTRIMTLLLMITFSLSINSQTLTTNKRNSGKATVKGTLDFKSAKYNEKSLKDKTITITFEVKKTAGTDVLSIGYHQNLTTVYKEYSVVSFENLGDQVNIVGYSFFNDEVQIKYNNKGALLNYNLNEEYYDTHIWENYYYIEFANK